MSNAAHVQRKLMDYFVQNPDDFNDKFQVEEVPCANLDGIICTDEASQYIKFSMDFNPIPYIPERKPLCGKH